MRKQKPCSPNHLSAKALRPFSTEKSATPPFRRVVRQAYDLRCAVSGLRLVNGGGGARRWQGGPNIQTGRATKNGPITSSPPIGICPVWFKAFCHGMVDRGTDFSFFVLTMGSILKPPPPHGGPARTNFGPAGSGPERQESWLPSTPCNSTPHPGLSGLGHLRTMGLQGPVRLLHEQRFFSKTDF